MSSHEVIVIGAGQAGLAAGKALKDAGIDFVIVDGAKRIGNSWRNRFDSLRLFSPRSLSALPGIPLPGPERVYPTKDEIADYLESYAGRLGFPVKLAARATSLRKCDDGFRVIVSSGNEVESRAVLVAAGAFQVPDRPAIAADLASEIAQLDSMSYKNPGSLPEGRVLVVGSGATGRQIAAEVAAHRETWLARGSPAIITPHRLLGRDVTWWAKVSGLLTADKGTWRGRLARRHDSFPGSQLNDKSLLGAGVRLVGRAVAARADRVGFARGTEQEFRTVIWATGYRDDNSWIDVDGALRDGAILEDRGVSPVPGLYYIGRSWQKSRASALICGVGREAEEIVAHLGHYLRARDGMKSPASLARTSR